MKRIKVALLIGFTIVFNSCGEVCYKCEKTNSTHAFCGERSEMKDAKKAHEDAGYTCKKVSDI